jgi:hypothetical protein
LAQAVLGRMEARARREGEVSALRRAAVRVLRSRFPDHPQSLVPRIESLDDPNRLEDLTARAVTAAHAEQIEALLAAL